MTKLITVDSEQEAMLRATLGGMSAFLSARVERRDPAKMLSRALKLQDTKIANMFYQLDLPPVATWDRLHPGERQAFLNLMDAMRDAKTDTLRAVIFVQILTFILATRRQRLTIEAVQGDQIETSK